MTIGEKIKELFPNINFGTLAQDDMVVNKDYSNNNELQVFIPKRVWDTEYKEPNKDKESKEIQEDLDKHRSFGKR